jgi:hypothetical protein
VFFLSPRESDRGHKDHDYIDEHDYEILIHLEFKKDTPLQNARSQDLSKTFLRCGPGQMRFSLLFTILTKLYYYYGKGLARRH